MMTDTLPLYTRLWLGAVPWPVDANDPQTFTREAEGWDVEVQIAITQGNHALAYMGVERAAAMRQAAQIVAKAAEASQSNGG
jgi:hypothetical protein